MHYDANDLREQAEHVYGQGTAVQLIWFLAFAFPGWWIGARLAFAWDDADVWIVFSIIGALIVGAIGLAVGTMIAARLRLAALHALCQAEIEEHLKAMKPAAPPVFPNGPPRRAPNMTPGAFEGR